MRLPKSKLEMVSMIAQESGRSRQLVKHVIDNFENSLRFYLSNPLHAGEAILLSGFGKFIFDKEKAARRMQRIRSKQKKEYYNNYLNKFSDEEE